ncbi:WD40 repeat domain-containing serine/threonine protein kinase [Spirillospora sp. CA-255316]
MRPLAQSDPRHVGPYRTLAELGRGGMGRVLLGSAPDGRLVAVKLVHARLVGVPGFRDRFRDEVAATRAVSGAYTAAVIDADADAPTPWLASVYVPGPSLHDAVRAAGALPVEPVLRLAAGLAAALLDIHRSGLVHRDLKPSNVLLAADGPRVIDFGVARAVESGDGDQTQTGLLAGTPGFMSPEEADARQPTAASDIFSLGCVLAMACTGRGPFDGPGVPQTLYNVVHTAPVLDAVPGRLRPIVEACLAKDPDARPAPDRLLTMIGHVAPSTRPWPPAVHRLIEERQAAIAGLLTPPSPPARHRGRLLVAGAIAGCATLTAAMLWALWPGPAAGSRPAPSASRSTPPPVSWPLRGHTSTIQSVTFSADGRTLLTASEDHTVRKWDVASRTQRGTPLQHPDGVNDVALGPRDIAIYTSGDDGSIRVWPMSGRGRQTGFDIRLGPVSAMAISPDGRVLATSSMSRVVRLWDLDDGRVGPALDTGAGSVEALAFAPDSRTLAVGTTGTRENADTGNTEGHVQLWEVYDRRKIGEDLTGFNSWVHGVAFSPDGRTLAAAGGDTARLWDVTTRSPAGAPIDCRSTCRTVTFSPDGRTLATAGGDTIARLWNLADRRQLGPDLKGHTGVIFSVRFSPDGRTLATAGADGTARLWPVPR